MKLAATIVRSRQADMQAELRDIEHAVATRARWGKATVTVAA